MKAGEDLDIAIAKDFFGWVTKDYKIRIITDNDWIPCPRYSTEMNAARAISEEISKKEEAVQNAFVKQLSILKITCPNSGEPELICKAALIAVGNAVKID